MFVQIYATVLTVISMYSPASASGLIHKSGVTVAEWRWWRRCGDFSRAFRLICEQADWDEHQRLDRRWTSAGFIYIATEQQWCRQGSAARPPNEAVTRVRAAANKPKQRWWAVLSRVFRPHAPAIYTRAASGRRSALLSQWSALQEVAAGSGWWRRPFCGK